MSPAMAPRRLQSEEMLSLLERHKIQVLLDAEFSAADVATRTGVSVDTVRRMRRESCVTHTDDKREHRERSIGRPSVAAPYELKMAQWLRDDPDLPTQELLRRAKEDGTGHKTWQSEGTVERLVGWIKSSFFKPPKFQDERDVHAQLAAWLVEVNERTPSRATKVIPEIRRREELPRLRPVKVLPETLAIRVPVMVGPTAETMFEGMYPMPPKAAHVAGTAFVYENRLRIIAGRFEAEHRRRRKGDTPAPLP